MEWGYQKVGIGNPTGNLSQASGWQARAGRIGGVIFEGFEIPSPSITIESDGEIKTHSLMGNVYYRYPKWRVSPYAGLGLGAFFHDGVFTSTVTVENELGTIGLPNIELPAEPLRTTVAYEDSPVCLSDHGRPLDSGLPARGVPLRLSLSLQSGGADRCRPDRGRHPIPVLILP